ncbi:MAG: PTS IIA-like nitrogen regulatory protein PtsN [Hyphomicrobiales bacterium]
MQLSQILERDAVFYEQGVRNKKALLKEIAARATKLTGLEERTIFETLLQRERLGSTGLGSGIAIPHGKFADLKKVVGLFVRLSAPIEFEALDDQPVDLVFVLLAPESAGADHLKALAKVSRLLRDNSIIQKLRGTEDTTALYSVLTEPASSASHAA